MSIHEVISEIKELEDVLGKLSEKREALLKKAVELSKNIDDRVDQTMSRIRSVVEKLNNVIVNIINVLNRYGMLDNYSMNIDDSFYIVTIDDKFLCRHELIQVNKIYVEYSSIIISYSHNKEGKENKAHCYQFSNDYNKLLTCIQVLTSEKLLRRFLEMLEEVRSRVETAMKIVEDMLKQNPEIQYIMSGDH